MRKALRTMLNGFYVLASGLLVYALLLSTTIPVFAEGITRYDNPNGYSREDALLHAMDYYDTSDLSNSSAYFYDYTGLQLYFVYEEAYTYDDDWNQITMYSSQEEFRETVMNIAKDILKDDPMGVVSIEAQGTGSIKSFYYVMFGAGATEYLSTDAENIITEIFLQPGCVIEDWGELMRTSAVKLIVPLVMDGMTWETFESEYYYSWITPEDYDENIFEVIADVVIWTLYDYAYIIVPCVLLVIGGLVVFKVKHGYKKKSDAEAALLQAQIEKEKAEAEYLKAKADAEILEADLYNDSDPVLNKYKEE